MDKNSVFGEVLEKGQTAVANTVSSTANATASDLSQTIAEQMGIQPKSQTQTASNQVSNPSVVQTGDLSTGAQTSEASKEIVEEFYSPSDQNTSSNNSQSSSDDSGSQIQARLVKVREELHKDTYYDPLFSYENKKPEPTKADVIAQEEQQKMQELAVDQQKKNEDLATTRAKIAVEANRGVAG